MLTVTVKFGLEAVTKQVDPGSTVEDVVENSSIRAGLGYGDNVRALVNGVEMPDTAFIGDNTTIVVETRCNSKAMAEGEQSIVIRFGLESVTKVYRTPVYVSTVKNDASVKAALGFGDNIRILQNGVELPDNALLSNGSAITVETRCNSKA